MSSIPYIETVSGYTFFLEGNPVSVDSSDARYTEVTNALRDNDMEQLRGILRDNKEAYLLSKISTITQYFSDLKFTITKNSLNDSEEVVSADVSYKGQPLPEVLKQKLIEMYKAGATDFSHLFNFIDNLLANPDKNSREQLYGFLVHKNMPITDNGTFIAYKGVRGDYYSITGNTSTVVLEGKVNEQGHILNEFGKTIRVRHEDVENDPTISCSQGLHVGSYEYAKGFKSCSGRLLAVEVNPKDVVSVPIDCACQKCRVSAYKVLNEVTTHFKSLTATINENNEVEESDLVETAEAQVDVNLETMIINTVIHLLDTVEGSEFKTKMKTMLSEYAAEHCVLIDKTTTRITIIRREEAEKLRATADTNSGIIINNACTLDFVVFSLIEISSTMLMQCLVSHNNKYTGPYKYKWDNLFEEWETDFEDMLSDADTEDEDPLYDSFVDYVNNRIYEQVDNNAWRRVLLHLGFNVQVAGVDNRICFYQL